MRYHVPAEVRDVDGIFVPFYLVEVEFLSRPLLGRASYVRARGLVHGVFGHVVQLDPPDLGLLDPEELPGWARAMPVLDFRVDPDRAVRAVLDRISPSYSLMGLKLPTVRGGLEGRANPFEAMYVARDGVLWDPFTGEACQDPLILGAFSLGRRVPGLSGS